MKHQWTSFLCQGGGWQAQVGPGGPHTCRQDCCKGRKAPPPQSFSATKFSAQEGSQDTIMASVLWGPPPDSIYWGPWEALCWWQG